MKKVPSTRLDLSGRMSVPAAELDPLLDVPRAKFARIADRLIRRLDAAGVSIELEPTPLREILPAETLVPSGPSILATYRAEVARIVPMDRADEVRLARRFDLVRRRLRRALGGVGSTADPSAGADDSSRFATSCDHDGTRGVPVCLFAEAPVERLETLHARRREYDAARNVMVERSLYLVFRLIERFRGLGVPTLDLVQEGSASLFRAVEKYEWWRNVRFSTYATFWVNQAFLNLLYRTGRTVRVPAYIQKAMKKINAARAAVGDAKLPPEAIAESSGLPVELVKSVLSTNRYSLSLDRELWSEDPGDGRRFLDLLEDPGAEIDFDSLEDSRLGERLKQAMECLNARERLIVELRFGLNGARPHTLAEVGKILGVSLERVRQIQEVAVRRMAGGQGRALLAPLLS